MHAWIQETLKPGPRRADVHILCKVKWVSLFVNVTVMTTIVWKPPMGVCMIQAAVPSSKSLSLLHVCSILNASQPPPPHLRKQTLCAKRGSRSLGFPSLGPFVGSLVTFHVVSARAATAVVIFCCGTTLVLLNAGPGWWMGGAALWSRAVWRNSSLSSERFNIHLKSLSRSR